MIYDLAIIGGGPAGLSAAVYAARFMLNSIVLAAEPGGTMMKVHCMENWPGEKRSTGASIADKLLDHTRDVGAKIIQAEVKSVSRKGKNFLITSDSGDFEAKSLLFATGTKHRKLGIPGEDGFYGRGVSTCAVCDCGFFRDMVVAVIGGSDSAANEALLLTENAKKVYIIYRKERIRAEPINFERVAKNPKIEVITNTNVREIRGDKRVRSVVLDRPYQGSTELKLDGVFVEIGYDPHSELAKSLGVKVNELGEIIVGSASETNVLGVFAAGDVTSGRFKQAITAAAQGVVAAYSAYNYLTA